MLHWIYKQNNICLLRNSSCAVFSNGVLKVVVARGYSQVPFIPANRDNVKILIMMNSQR